MQTPGHQLPFKEVMQTAPQADTITEKVLPLSYEQMQRLTTLALTASTVEEFQELQKLSAISVSRPAKRLH